MTFSLVERLYSMITGLRFSSIPIVSIRPPSVTSSEARKRHSEQGFEIFLEQELERALERDGAAGELGDGAGGGSE